MLVDRILKLVEKTFGSAVLELVGLQLQLLYLVPAELSLKVGLFLHFLNRLEPDLPKLADLRVPQRPRFVFWSSAFRRFFGFFLVHFEVVDDVVSVLFRQIVSAGVSIVDRLVALREVFSDGFELFSFFLVHLWLFLGS